MTKTRNKRDESKPLRIKGGDWAAGQGDHIVKPEPQLKVTDYTQAGTEERITLAALIYRAAVLEQIAPIWKLGILASPHANMLGKMCVDYYKQHHEAPGDAILNILWQWAEKTDDDNAKESMGELVQYALAMHRPNDSDTAVFDIVHQHLKRTQVKKLAETIQNESSNGHLDKSIERLRRFDAIELGGSSLTADEVVAKLAKWIWAGWLPRGEMTLADGLPGEGKGLLGVDIAARVSRGFPMPPAPKDDPIRDPANVVMVVAEDSWEHTTKHRLIAAGADLKNIYLPKKDFPLFPQDLPMVKAIVKQTRAELLIIDPILSFVGDAKTDTNAESHVRRFLLPILELTRSTGVATFLVRHFKKEKANAIHRGLGSQAFTAMCRLQHVVGDPDGSKRVVLANAKNNLHPIPPSLAFRIVPVSMPLHPGNKPKFGETVDTAKIEWLADAVKFSADDVARGRNQAVQGRPSRTEEIKRFILRRLEDSKGKMSSEVLLNEGTSELGVSDKTFMAARKEMKTEGIIKTNKEGFQGKWMVCLAQRRK